MYSLILALHVFVCVLLIIAVLLQPSKGSDLSSALGGGSGSGFGPSTPASMVNKITTAIAACFLILSFALALLSSGKTESSLLKDYRSVPAAEASQE